jgi:chemotaxis protein methyltransferase CheR
VLATDISTEVLQHAQSGIYTKEQIEVLPEMWRRRYTKPMPDGEHVRISDEIKNEVLFRKFNLMDPFPFRRRMHVIFLRNVMIYFDAETKQRLLKKVYDILEPGGYLFIGRTETIDRSVVPLVMIQPSIFRKKEER